MAINNGGSERITPQNGRITDCRANELSSTSASRNDGLRFNIYLYPEVF